MSYLQILGLLVTGAGTLASILGIFFAVYAKQNGKVMRELITSENKNMREFLEKFIADENKNMREFIASENRNIQEFIAKTIRELGNELGKILDRIDLRAEERHREVMVK
ncbi:MAG: hypothetical protein AB1297_07805 [bacterium]